MNGLRFWLTTCLMLSVAVSPGTSSAEETFPAADAVAVALATKLPDADGKSPALAARLGKSGSALVFLSTECPISNGYVPVLNRLKESFGKQGIAFVGINSNDPQSQAAVAEHARKFGITFPVVKDAGAIVADQLGIGTCPMVLVLDGRQRPVYLGRIDDRYTRRAGGARDVRRADLEIALEELLAGKAISIPVTEPIGCPLLTNTDRTETKLVSAKEATTTYSEHISRLMQKHCQECHRPGGAGPFSLLTYADAVSWADDLKTFTANRTMPPWSPKSGHDLIENARVMTDSEIRQIAAWVDAGTPEGDPKRLPEPLVFRDGWKLGTPDIVLTPTESFTLSADGKDEYRCFVLPTNYDKDLYVKAMEVLPGTRAVVHHVLAFLDTRGQAAKLDEKAPLPGYATTAGYPGFLPTGGLGGWAPGNTPEPLPDGMAKLLPKGADVVIQVHYHKTGKIEHDQTQIGLYLAKEPVNRLAHGMAIVPYGARPRQMTIPAGEKNYEVQGGLVLQKDLLVLTVTPHMHLLGKDMKVTAKLPDGTETTIIDTLWNFNWQESYQFKKPIALPKGTELKVVAHYDNTEGNPHNPNHPPETVRWGEQTNNEMCIAFLEVTSQQSVSSPDDLRPDSPRELLRDALVGKWKADLQKRLENVPRRRFLPRQESPADQNR